jgi:hypothetical protein
MRRFYTAAAVVSLLVSLFEAPYVHLHGDPASDHARKHHHGKGLTLHSHFPLPQHPAAGLLAVQSRAESADYDAIFLAQASNLARLPLLPALLPEARLLLPPPDPVRNLASQPAYRSHDPPLVPAISPRPPPA